MKVVKSGAIVNMTAKDYAKKHNMDYQDAANLLRILHKEGGISIVGHRGHAGGRGKPATVYAIPEGITITEMQTLDERHV